MFETPTTWLGFAVVTLIVIERALDHWVRWKEGREWAKEGHARRHGNLHGSTNGVTAIATRLNGIESRFDQAFRDNDSEWHQQRKQDRAIHERITVVDRAVARIEGAMRGPGGTEPGNRT